ncbi:hypothetical protein FE263_18465 [Lichenicoccus roseus]|uniref:Uncharacterized protein n=2 Tax=Lichenicoccus roseus TaxID=2683649 RepID=A0A5R9J0I8_9PROT|nr:hypothetical protein FE263_18465 [Lichenicoccus roseus]
MPDYRVLILDQEVRVLAFETFNADDDQLAWKHVRMCFTAAYAVELWCGTRRVDLIGQQVSRGA